MFDFFGSLQARLEVIENQNMTLQAILFNLAKLSLHQRLNKSRGAEPNKNLETSNGKIYLEFKLPPKKINEAGDFQKALFTEGVENGNKRKIEVDEDNDQLKQAFKPKKKSFKLNQ